MDNIDFIFALLQTYVAFIAFATIVATLRQSFGTPLTPFQYILFRFFVESGLLHVILLLVPIMLFNLFGDTLLVWRLTTYSVIIVPIIYAVNYLMRRRKVRNARTPPTTVAVILGYCGFAVFNSLISIENLPGNLSQMIPLEPSMLSISIYFMWSMVAVILIFLTFLSTFIHYEKDDDEISAHSH